MIKGKLTSRVRVNLPISIEGSTTGENGNYDGEIAAYNDGEANPNSNLVRSPKSFLHHVNLKPWQLVASIGILP